MKNNKEYRIRLFTEENTNWPVNGYWNTYEDAAKWIFDEAYNQAIGRVNSNIIKAEITEIVNGQIATIDIRKLKTLLTKILPAESFKKKPQRRLPWR